MARCLDPPAMLKSVCAVQPEGEPQKIFNDPTHGPGTEFRKLAASFGLTVPCGGCKALLTDMDRWGIDECERRMPEILRRMRDNEKHLKWGAFLKAAGKALAKRYRSRKALLIEAIRRAREKASTIVSSLVQ
jgi:hypothetical protein